MDHENTQTTKSEQLGIYEICKRCTRDFSTHKRKALALQWVIVLIQGVVIVGCMAICIWGKLDGWDLRGILGTMTIISLRMTGIVRLYFNRMI